MNQKLMYTAIDLGVIERLAALLDLGKQETLELTAHEAIDKLVFFQKLEQSSYEARTKTMRAEIQRLEKHVQRITVAHLGVIEHSQDLRLLLDLYK